MAEQNNQNQDKFNIYEAAGKAGKAVKKYGGIVLAAGVTFLLKKGADFIKDKKA